MDLFRWILLAAGVLIIGGVFAYSKGLISFRLRLPRLPDRKPAETEVPVAELEEPAEAEPVEPAATIETPQLSNESLVVTVRMMPTAGTKFPAEQLILALRECGLKHGKFGIFHCLDEETETRIRFSVASLVEPGSFDLTKLKDSVYGGVSIFMVLPAPEDGVNLFDDMLQSSRQLAKKMGGNLVDERGGALSVQRERYMREEVIEFLRRHRKLTGDSV